MVIGIADHSQDLGQMVKTIAVNADNITSLVSLGLLTVTLIGYFTQSNGQSE